MEKYCDNHSVGVILTNENDELALLTRGRFPIGIAPPAGHIDEHGSPEQAAIDEVMEEVGVRLSLESLHKTIIRTRRVENICRRIGGDHHVWTIYHAAVAQAELHPDPDETRGAAWYSQDEVQKLADRTRKYRMGVVNQREWVRQPGIEPVWVDFFAELGYITTE